MVRIRRSALERAALVDEWRGSGLSVPAFCARRGLNPKTVAGWIYKPAHKAALDRVRRPAGPGAAPAGVPPAPAPAFVAIEVAGPPAPARERGRSGVEIRLRRGRRVAVSPGFDEGTLRRVLAVLEGRPC